MIGLRQHLHATGVAGNLNIRRPAWWAGSCGQLGGRE